MYHTRIKHTLIALFCAAGLSIAPAAGYAQEQAEAGKTEQKQEKITVYKTPTCGCCKKWVKHLEEAGFQVESHDLKELRFIKQQAGVTPELASCHTALVGGYTIEGHVPAADIKRLLREKPALRGLAVPKMPMGSPGMEGSRKDPYKVVGFDEEGKTTTFTEYTKY